MTEVSEQIDELTEDEFYELYNMLIFMKADSLDESDPGLKETIELAMQCVESAYGIHPNYGNTESDEDEDENATQPMEEEQVESDEEFLDEFLDEEEDFLVSPRQIASDPGPIAGPSSKPDPIYAEPAVLPSDYDCYRGVPVGRSASDMSLHPKSSRLSEEEAEAKRKRAEIPAGMNYFNELSTPRVSDITDVGDDPDLCNAKGNELCNGQKYKESLAYYTKAMELNPKEPLYVYNRALAYMGMEIFILCVKDCKQAIHIDPKYSKAYLTLSEAYLQMDDPRKAERECKKAVNLEPDNDEYIQQLVMIQEKMEEDF